MKVYCVQPKLAQSELAYTKKEHHIELLRMGHMMNFFIKNGVPMTVNFLSQKGVKFFLVAQKCLNCSKTDDRDDIISYFSPNSFTPPFYE